MIDQGSSELNIIIGVANEDFETAIQAIYDIFVITDYKLSDIKDRSVRPVFYGSGYWIISSIGVRIIYW